MATVAAACDDAPPVPPRHPKHDIIIEGGKVKYNGTWIGPGVPGQVAIDALGPPSHRRSRMDDWASLGLGIRRFPKDSMLTECVRIMFEPRNDGDTLETFPGRVLLEGAPLFKGVQVIHVRQLMKLECDDQVPRGYSFNDSGLPNHQSCRTKSPPRTYWLRVSQRNRKLYAQYLEVCCAESGC